MSTIVGWCRTGRLDGIQTVRDGPWWINLTPEDMAELGKPNNRGSGATVSTPREPRPTR
jgi:hypothetical protein